MRKVLRGETFGDPTVPVSAEWFLLDAEVAAHGHAFIEMAVVLGGTATHVSAAGSAPVSRGSVVVLRPGDWHGIADIDGLALYNVYIGPELLSREMSWISEDPNLAGIFSPAHPDGTAPATLNNDALGHVEQWCAAIAENRDRAWQLGHLTLIVGELAGTTRQIPRMHPAVTDAVRLLEERIADPWTLPELAAAVNLTPAYLIRLFRRQLGWPPMAYLNRLRAEKAGTLLIETDLPVSTIGGIVGWHDPSYASRRFTASFAMSPAKYRNAFRPPPTS